ncbi:restriction endonuclease subunit S [Kurthia gibsonii]|uniref:restriction endonuclease subunit S n=1 Tax=Kurthia gibsonii TaxID=33946 RepID=UPI003F21A8AC
MEYKNYQLSNICKYRKEKIVTTKVKKEEYISTENMLANKQGIEESKSLPQSKSINRFEEKDILISNIRPYFKKIWFSTMMGGASPDVLIIEADQSKVTPEFLYYLLSQEDFFNFMVQTSKGTKMPRGDKDAIMQYKVKLFNKEKQREIVNILSSIDEKVQNNKLIISNLEQLSQTLFKQWFIDFEFPNEEGKPYKSSGGEMVESELGEIPKKWCSKKFNSIMKISSGKRPKIKADNYSLENSIPIIGASKLMGYTREMLFDSPILVIGRVGTHGVVQKIVDRCWPSDNTLVIQSEFYNFVYEFLKVIDYKSLNRGSTQPLITQTDIKNQTIIVPEDLTIMKKFEEILMPLLNKQFLLLKENESLTQIRDTLLPKLLSGEIEIPDDLEV